MGQRLLSDGYNAIVRRNAALKLRRQLVRIHSGSPEAMAVAHRFHQLFARWQSLRDRAARGNDVRGAGLDAQAALAHHRFRAVDRHGNAGRGGFHREIKRALS